MKEGGKASIHFGSRSEFHKRPSDPHATTRFGKERFIFEQECLRLKRTLPRGTRILAIVGRKNAKGEISKSYLQILLEIFFPLARFFPDSIVIDYDEPSLVNVVFDDDPYEKEPSWKVEIHENLKGYRFVNHIILAFNAKLAAPEDGHSVYKPHIDCRLNRFFTSSAYCARSDFLNILRKGKKICASLEWLSAEIAFKPETNDRYIQLGNYSGTVKDVFLA